MTGGRIRREERGAGTVLTVGVTMVLMVVACAAAVVVAWLGRGVLAQDAADAAALAGAAAMAEGLEACPSAGDAAERNGARLTGCDVRGDRRAFVVAVVVEVALEPQVPGFPQKITGRAAAGAP